MVRAQRALKRNSARQTGSIQVECAFFSAAIRSASPLGFVGPALLNMGPPRFVSRLTGSET